MIDGYSYVTYEGFAASITRWQEIQSKCLAAGGSRRTQGGETFLRGKNGILQYEIYAVIPLAKVKP